MAQVGTWSCRQTVAMKNNALELLQKALANPAADFRAGQWECIEGILRSQRQLVVQKTGWGKVRPNVGIPRMRFIVRAPSPLPNGRLCRDLHA